MGNPQSDVIASIEPTATVADAAELMQKRHASALVVVDDAGRLVGILTERDLLAVIVDGDDPSSIPVSQRMSIDVVTADPDTDAMAARELMGRHNIRHIPVVEGGRVVGMIEQTEPSVGLNFGGRRQIPDHVDVRPVIEGVQGP